MLTRPAGREDPTVVIGVNAGSYAARSFMWTTSTAATCTEREHRVYQVNAAVYPFAKP